MRWRWMPIFKGYMQIHTTGKKDMKLVQKLFFKRLKNHLIYVNHLILFL